VGHGRRGSARLAGLRESAKDRENLLSAYGPLAVFLLLGAWVTLLIVGFALLQWANGSALSTTGEKPTFWVDLYFSATTFLTLGLGDVTPRPMGLPRGLTAVGRWGASASWPS